MENYEHLVYSREVIEFTAVANEYCNILENSGRSSGLQLLRVEQKLLPLLYYKTLMIAGFDPVNDEPVEKFVTETDWENICQRVIGKLGEANDFLEVFDARMADSEGPVTGSIAENLTDIYQDLKDYLINYNIGTTEIMNDALWECLENFRLYWGQKLVNTIRAVHNALAEPEKIGQVNEKKGNGDTSSVDTSDWFITQRQNENREQENEDI